MFQLHSTPPPRRSGVILLIVVVMLGLFLVVGLSFMLYAESEASASRIYREAFTDQLRPGRHRSRRSYELRARPTGLRRR